MAFLWIIWDDENDPLGNVQHIAEHGLTTDEVEVVLDEPDSADSSLEAIAVALGLEVDLVEADA